MFITLIFCLRGTSVDAVSWKDLSGVVLPQLVCEIFRAIISQCLSIFPPTFEHLGSLHKISVKLLANFSQL